MEFLPSLTLQIATSWISEVGSILRGWGGTEGVVGGNKANHKGLFEEGKATKTNAHTPYPIPHYKAKEVSSSYGLSLLHCGQLQANNY